MSFTPSNMSSYLSYSHSKGTIIHGRPVRRVPWLRYLHHLYQQWRGISSWPDPDKPPLRRSLTNPPPRQLECSRDLPALPRQRTHAQEHARLFSLPYEVLRLIIEEVLHSKRAWWHAYQFSLLQSCRLMYAASSEAQTALSYLWG